MDWLDLGLTFVKTLAILLTVVNTVPIMSWVERRGAALIQDRPGPNRVGPLGLIQPIADFVKFIWKEDPTPANVSGVLYTIAPFLSLLPACLVLAALPVGDHLVVMGREVRMQIADLDVGLLYVLAISSLGIYGILFGGWASNNKFSLLGGLRSASQMISYEIPLAIAATGMVLFYGTLNLREIVLWQEGTLLGVLPRWGVVLQPFGFLLFLIAAFAETNRLPFDLPETEAELVAGYHTEYGSMKFATFMMAEYMNLTTISGMMVTLYFGGWHIPWIGDSQLLAWFGGSRNILGLFQFVVFFTKVTAFLFLFVWVRWTVPRFRFDQLMRLAWGRLIPLTLLNLVVSAVVLYLVEGR